MTLDERLNNWAKAQRYGSGHTDGAVASIYFPGAGGRTIESSVDIADAHLVELAWRKLLPLDKKLLQMRYMWNARPEVICRRLGLKVRPTSIFDLALAHAKQAIDQKLAPEPVRHVSIQEIIDHLKENSLAETK
jgi:hypothetical protein